MLDEKRLALQKHDQQGHGLLILLGEVAVLKLNHLSASVVGAVVIRRFLAGRPLELLVEVLQRVELPVIMFINHDFILQHLSRNLTRAPDKILPLVLSLAIIELLAVPLPVGTRVADGNHGRVRDLVHSKLGPIELGDVVEPVLAWAVIQLCSTGSENLCGTQLKLHGVNCQDLLLHRDGHNLEIPYQLEDLSHLLLRDLATSALLLAEHVENLAPQLLVLTSLDGTFLLREPVLVGGLLQVTTLWLGEKEPNELLSLV